VRLERECERAAAVDRAEELVQAEQLVDALPVHVLLDHCAHSISTAPAPRRSYAHSRHNHVTRSSVRNA
jgi:hypothetical protein